jgi:uncharacterized protein (TIGR02246 family)
MTTALQAYRRSPSLEQKAAAENLVRSMQDAFNAKDPDALGRNLGRDAVWTNALGMRAVGRRSVVELARGMMRRFNGNFARYEIAHLMPIGDEACVVNVVQVPTDRGGRDLNEMRATPIFVIARGEEGWKIEAGQNTLIVETGEGE